MNMAPSNRKSGVWPTWVCWCDAQERVKQAQSRIEQHEEGETIVGAKTSTLLCDFYYFFRRNQKNEEKSQI